MLATELAGKASFRLAQLYERRQATEDPLSAAVNPRGVQWVWTRILLPVSYPWGRLDREEPDIPRRAANWPAVAHKETTAPAPQLVADPGALRAPGADLSGEWEILEVEDDKRYKATLDKSGNGPYTQQGGQFTTTKFADRLWQGTCKQPGNDREGGFELLL